MIMDAAYRLGGLEPSTSFRSGLLLARAAGLLQDAEEVFSRMGDQASRTLSREPRNALNQPTGLGIWGIRPLKDTEPTCPNRPTSSNDFTIRLR